MAEALGRNPRARIRSRLAAVAVAMGVAMTWSGAPSASGAGPKPIAIDVSGANGTGLIDRPGRSCAEGGNGAHFHYEYGSPLASGSFGAVPGNLRLHLDLHSQATGAPQPVYTNAFLQGSESSAALSNERGTVRLALRSGTGTCANPNLAFNGTKLTAPANGTWTVAEATGSYRQATPGGGANTFQLTAAEMGPGADNPFRLKLNGSIQVLQPALQVTVKKTYWGFFGADYLTRRVTVVYDVKNVGTGDAYGVRLTDATSPTEGVTVLGPKVQKLGDLAAGESEEARVRFQFGLQKPCSLVITNCAFNSKLTVSMPDALDGPNSFSKTVQAKAPALPPPVL